MNKMKRQSGYHVYAFGEKFWHRSLDAATKRAAKAQAYCPNPQIIEVKTGKRISGRPE